MFKFIKYYTAAEQDVPSILYLRPITGDGIHIVGYETPDASYQIDFPLDVSKIVSTSPLSLPAYLNTISTDWTTPNAEQIDDYTPFDSSHAVSLAQRKLYNLLLNTTAT